MSARARRTYRYVWADPWGRVFLIVVWVGLAFITGGFAAYLPVWLERRAIQAAALGGAA